MLSTMGAKKFTRGWITLRLNQPETVAQMLWMEVQRPEKNPPMMPGMGVKKFTTGSMTLVLNQPETAAQTAWMMIQQPWKKPLIH